MNWRDMKTEAREELIRALEKQESAARLSKGAAYSSADDCLSNFKRNAERLSLTKYQIWAVYFMKHIDAILNAISANPVAPEERSEGMCGRIMDARVYLELLYCMLHEDISFVQYAAKENPSVVIGLDSRGFAERAVADLKEWVDAKEAKSEQGQQKSRF